MLNQPSSEVLTAKSRQYLAAVDSRIGTVPPAEIASHVESLVRLHDLWRDQQCLNMNPAEGAMTHRARQILASDMATRVAEGFPGDKIFPHHEQTKFIDEIEGIVISLVRRRFGAKHVEWRPASTSMANTIAFFSLLNHGDALLVQHMDGGGNYSYQTCGGAGLRSQRIFSIEPTGTTFEIDPRAVARQAAEIRPKMIVVGGGKVLFPYPLRQLRDIADRYEAILLYDAAHLGLLISSGTFQRPLEEGAHVVTVGTHKSMGGPVGGLILTNHASIAKKVAEATFPHFLQTRDQNKLAALAITLAEHEAFGVELAERMVANARALAGALQEEGFSVVNRSGVHTATHQVFLDLGDTAQVFERRCNQANILIPDCALTGDMAENRRRGARLGTHEISRLGMGPTEMREIARLIWLASRDDGAPESIANEVKSLRARFPRTPFSFPCEDARQPMLRT